MNFFWKRIYFEQKNCSKIITRNCIFNKPFFSIILCFSFSLGSMTFPVTRTLAPQAAFTVASCNVTSFTARVCVKIFLRSLGCEPANWTSHRRVLLQRSLTLALSSPPPISAEVCCHGTPLTLLVSLAPSRCPFGTRYTTRALTTLSAIPTTTSSGLSTRSNKHSKKEWTDKQKERKSSEKNRKARGDQRRRAKTRRVLRKEERKKLEKNRWNKTQWGKKKNHKKGTKRLSKREKKKKQGMRRLDANGWPAANVRVTATTDQTTINEFKVFCGHFFEDERVSFFFEPTRYLIFSRVFSSLRRHFSLFVQCFLFFAILHYFLSWFSSTNLLFGPLPKIVLFSKEIKNSLILFSIIFFLKNPFFPDFSTLRSKTVTHARSSKNILPFVCVFKLFLKKYLLYPLVSVQKKKRF